MELLPPTSYRFTGQRKDATIGLYFYNSRYYDPLLGRFTQADTIVPEPGAPQNLKPVQLHPKQSGAVYRPERALWKRSTSYLTRQLSLDVALEISQALSVNKTETLTLKFQAMQIAKSDQKVDSSSMTSPLKHNTT